MGAKVTQLRKNPNMTPEAIKEITAIEGSKLSDSIETEYGFNLEHLGKAIRHYNLENDESLVNLRRTAMQKQQAAMNQAAMMQ